MYTFKVVSRSQQQSYDLNEFGFCGKRVRGNCSVGKGRWKQLLSVLRHHPEEQS